MKLAILIWIVHFYSFVACLEFHPSDREVNVFENDEYYVGFEYHQNIDRCAYRNNKGNSSFFTVQLLNDDSRPKLEIDGTRNQILEGGSMSKCGIAVRNVTLDGATSWTITAKQGQRVLEEVTVKINIFSRNTLRHTPHSQKVYVAHGGQYRVGFWYNKAIRTCMWETSTGLQEKKLINYEEKITQEDLEIENTLKDNVLFHYANKGICKLHMIRATKDGPSWIKMKAWGSALEISTITFDINVITNDSLEFVPSSRTMSIPKSCEYAFGFSHHLGIAKCFVQSDSGIDFSFEVDSAAIPKEKENQEYEIAQVYDFIPNNNKGSICKIVVRNADSVTRRWTITASDGINNITSENVLIYEFEKSPLLNKAIYIHEGASFAQAIRTNKASEDIEKCTLRFVNNTIDFYSKLGNINAKPNPIVKHIVPWNYGTCGFKFLNIEKGNVLSNLKWNLIAKTRYGYRFGDEFSVELVSYPKEHPHEVVLGQSYDVRCHYNYQEFCELYNPSGTLMRRGFICDYTINAVTQADIGKWRCVASLHGSMESVTFSINLKRIDTGLYSFAKDDDEYLTLTCGFTKKTWISTCQMHSPTNIRYVLNPYLGSNGITALGTNFEEGKCAMQIKKPLRREDQGSWKCEINADGHIFGAIIEVGADNKEHPVDATYSKKTFRAFEPFLLIWDVSFSSPNCYIQSPNGDVFSSDHPYQSTFGRCTLLVTQTYPAKNGNWTCYFAQPDTEDNVKSVINVDIMEFSPTNYYVRAEKGSPLMLSYLSGGEPIQRCIFVSPNNESYYVRNHHKTENITYKGKGLEYGECGMEITKTSDNHFGIWKCFSKIGLNATEQNASANIWVIDSKAAAPDFDQVEAVSSISVQELKAPLNTNDNKDTSESGTWIAGIEITLGIIVLVGIGFASLFVYRRYTQQPIFVQSRNNEAVNMTFINTEQTIQVTS